MYIIRILAIFLLTLSSSPVFTQSQNDSFQTIPPQRSRSSAIWKAVDIRTDGFAIRWTASEIRPLAVLYGKDTAHLQTVEWPTQRQSDQLLRLEGLEAGAVYYVRPIVAGNPLPTRAVATQSNSSGQIQVWFNWPVDEQFLGNTAPEGQSVTACLGATIGRINAATNSIDVAMYNTSRDDIVDALRAAHQRGVRVRYIAASATDNYALTPAPPFPVLYGNEDALMHNKFMVIDADLPLQAWVMSGSMNWTYANTEDDYNNLLFVQDQSLARAYELEFEEMWGSESAQPNAALSRFGAEKTDNTPHEFIIGGVQVQSWFSPSDEATDYIVETINQADHSARFALFTFTHNDPGNALVDAWQIRQIDVRGIIENIDDSGAEYPYLLSQDVPVAAHTETGLLHHKYVVTDALHPDSDPTVLTGSHNWSYAAESQNDENTLVIHDSNIARMFYAEFVARAAGYWSGVEAADTEKIRVWPNPTNGPIRLEGELKGCRIRCFSSAGTCLFEQYTDYLPSDIHLDHLPAGLYLLQIDQNHTSQMIRVMKIF